MTHEPETRSPAASGRSARGSLREVRGPRGLAEYDDDGLLARVRDGDKEAFEALVTRHSGAVLGAATRVLGDPVAARRAAEGAFVDLWEGRAEGGTLRPRLAALTLRRCRGLSGAARGSRPGGALAGLPLEDREILVMRYGLDLGHEQMAELLGRPSEALRSRAYEALTRLRASKTVDTPRPGAAGRREP